MDDDKRSFWTSVPGILTGLAAVIGALGTIYLGLIRDDRDRGQVANVLPPQPAGTSTPIPPTEWPSVGTDTFTNASSGWTVGESPIESGRLERRIVEGKYRWDLVSEKPTTQWIASPYGSLVDFYAAVDVRLVDLTAKDPQMSLMFGKAANKDYNFTIARWPTGTYFDLTRFDGTKYEHLIDWTLMAIKLEEANRLAVVVDNSAIRLYLNAALVGDYRDPSFTGGKVALSVGAYSGGSIVVDFDNFELRRRPQ